LIENDRLTFEEKFMTKFKCIEGLSLFSYSIAGYKAISKLGFSLSISKK
jgi:hypothetical protein